ncbi:uncharacterized protein LOC135958481 [Calliphora vicina]|uniref:uncharacterized protein LOC135958481 n=1 Tax=Calliphora vicina TaxID=7373 RepID=UPI00325A67F8
MYKLFKLLLLLLLNVNLLQTQYTERCLFIKDNQFQQYCRGVYPQEVAIKYHDDWIKVGEPFIIYRSHKTPTEYVVSFKHSPLHECKIIEVMSAINFTCDPHQKQQQQQQDNKLIPLSLQKAIGACFPMNLYVMDDLLRICLHQNKRNEKLRKSSKTVLHYTMESGLTSDAAVGVAINVAI